MALYKPSELHAYLDEIGAAPKKSLSQNFLQSDAILEKITKAAAIQPGDWVLEIGPGPGALTERLLEHGANILAIEKDKLFAKGLSRLSSPPRLIVLEGDALEIDLASAITTHTESKLKLVANLPYSITSPLILLFLRHRELFQHATIMVQEEVARRLTATFNTKEWGHLSLLVQLTSTVDYSFFVSRRSFYPAPRVDSAVVQITPAQDPYLKRCEESAFFSWSRALFTMRRKTIQKTLKEFSLFQQIKEPEQEPLLSRRAESCSPQELVDFWRRHHKNY